MVQRLSPQTENKKPPASIAGGFFYFETSSLDYTVGKHCLGNFQEAGNICAHDIISRIAISFSCIQSGFVNALHDAVEFLVNFFASPGQAWRCSGSSPGQRLQHHQHWLLFQGHTSVYYPGRYQQLPGLRAYLHLLRHR